MTQESIQNAIKELASPYFDRRVNVFEVELAEAAGGAVMLRGRVLEQSDLDGLVSSLGKRFPGVEIDAQGIEVLRNPSTRRMSVATNLTSMHDGRSFLAEQVTQMLNGVVVEVLCEEGRWGYVRQKDGYLGWTYLPYLAEDLPLPPTHLVTAPVALLHDAPRLDSPLVTRVLGGTFAGVEEMREDWACLELAGGLKGWLLDENLRALDQLPGGPALRREVLVSDAMRMIGVPYLWGGCSANGIDCSGFAQLLHRWIGITIPRDADMQNAAGSQVEPPFEVGDLLFFGEKGEQRRITHVGISLGGWRMIHSSRRRNGVQVDDVQEVPSLRDDFLCAATYIGR